MNTNLNYSSPTPRGSVLLSLPFLVVLGGGELAWELRFGVACGEPRLEGAVDLRTGVEIVGIVGSKGRELVGATADNLELVAVSGGGSDDIPQGFSS